METYNFCHYLLLIGNSVDFNYAMQTVTIAAGTNSSTVNITVMDDDIVEGDEMFTMTLDVLATSPGIIAGAITMATATIIDSTSTLHHTK